MLNVLLIESEGIAILEPVGDLTEDDFRSAAELIDPLIERQGKLNGLIVHVEAFPSWDSFAALAAHLRFVHGHHENVARVALATNSPVGALAEHVGRHFVSAQIKRFDFDKLEDAKRWCLGRA